MPCSYWSLVVHSSVFPEKIEIDVTGNPLHCNQKMCGMRYPSNRMTITMDAYPCQHGDNISLKHIHIEDLLQANLLLCSKYFNSNMVQFGSNLVGQTQWNNFE